VCGYVELVGAVDEVQTVDRKPHFAAAAQGSLRRTVDLRVGAVTTHTLRVEYTDAEHHVSHGLIRFDVHSHFQRIAGLKHVRSAAVAAEQLDADDFDFPRSPTPFVGPEHVGRRVRAL
jgi:hypothetical protein